MNQKVYNVKEILCRKLGEGTVIEIQTQYWGGNIPLSTEGFSVDYFSKSIDRGRN